MIAKLRSTWLSINASYWFYPAIFSIFAFGLSFVTLYFDRNGASDYFNSYDWLHVSRPQGARATLQVIAGSMIGVASTVFSITIAAVAYASGNYGPRLLTNFMEDKGNQLSLATFIGTFVYALMIIRTVRDEDETAANAASEAASNLAGFTPQFSLMTAVGLALISVAVLVYFLHHIPASIRINEVLRGIGERLLRDLKVRFPEDGDPDEPEPADDGHSVVAEVAGYVQIIDFETLAKTAKDHDVRIALKVRTGDFVAPDLSMVEVIDKEVDDDLKEMILACFDIGGMRTPTQDLEFLMDELVEIALRALSPGINDPFTAITAMHWLAAATAEFGRRNLDRGPEQDDYDREYLRPLDDDFEHFLERGFGGVRASAAGSPLAAKKFIDGLYTAATGCRSTKRRRSLHTEAKTFMQQAEGALHGPALAELTQRFKRFDKTVRGMGI